MQFDSQSEIIHQFLNVLKAVSYMESTDYWIFQLLAIYCANYKPDMRMT